MIRPIVTNNVTVATRRSSPLDGLRCARLGYEPITHESCGNSRFIDIDHERAALPKANEEIIVERHRALNWLIRYMNQDWDDVTTDT